MSVSRAGLSSTIAIGMLLVGARVALAQEPTKQMCVAASESAQDLQRASKLLEAREQFRTCSAKACPRAVRQDCAESLRAVEKALPTIVLSPKDGGGAPDPTGATLAIDGTAMPDTLDGTPIPVDPGQHVFTVALSGRSPVSVRVSLAEGEQVQRDVVFRPIRAAAPKPVAADDADSAGQQPAPSPNGEHAVSEGRPKNLRWIGWTAVGVGGAGILVGSIFGILAVGDSSALSNACHDYSCPRSAQPDINGAHSSGDASTAAFTVGILGLGAGIAVLLLMPETKPDEASPARSAAAPLSVTRPAAIRARPWIGLGSIGMLGTFQ